MAAIGIAEHRVAAPRNANFKRASLFAGIADVERPTSGGRI